jgi:hypothetical protein
MSNLENNNGTKGKIRYQPPKLMWLGELGSASGLCSPGSIPLPGDCIVGPGFSAGTCVGGNYALSSCLGGAHPDNPYDM